MLQLLRVQFTPPQIDDEALAFGAHEEVGPGGHFLGAMHTLERFRECFYRPAIASTENSSGGSETGARRRPTAQAKRGARPSSATSSRRSTPRSTQSSGRSSLGVRSSSVTLRHSEMLLR